MSFAALCETELFFCGFTNIPILPDCVSYIHFIDIPVAPFK